jgi:hypothetical protein
VLAISFVHSLSYHLIVLLLVIVLVGEVVRAFSLGRLETSIEIDELHFVFKLIWRRISDCVTPTFVPNHV